MGRIETDSLKRLDLRKSGGLKSVVTGNDSALEITWKNPQGEILLEALFEKGGKWTYCSLSYAFKTLSGDFRALTEHLELERTPCYFGGKRPWFLCPGCHRRRLVLYFQGETFRCRLCHNLTYASANENRGSPFYHYRRLYRLEEAIGTLRARMKRENYAGQPTRKQKRLVTLERQFYSHAFAAEDKERVS